MNRLALLLRGWKIAQREWILWESSLTRRGRGFESLRAHQKR